MKRFRKVWDAEKDAFIRSTKGMRRSAAYAAFLLAFPSASDVTEVAFYDHRSRLGAAGKPSSPGGSRRPRPLWSEHVKKGYVRIKVAQPGTWISKSKWVYMETHPWEDFTERSCYIFLDGDNRNFRPENIERVPIRLMGLFNSLGGCERGRPEATRLRLLQARLKKARLDAAERLGLVGLYGTTRRIRYEAAAYQRRLNSTPERRKKACEAQARYRRRLKTEEPEKWRAGRERMKAYQREWYRRKRGKK